MKKAVKTILFLLVACVIVNMSVTNVWCETETEDGVFYAPWELDKMIEQMDKEFDEFIRKQSGSDKKQETVKQDIQSSADDTTEKIESKPQKTACEHEYEAEITKDPTCAEEGVLKRTCTKCKQSYTEAIPKNDDHSYESMVTKEAGCTEKGVMTYTCSICGDIYEEEIPETNHEYVTEVVKTPNCTEVGEEKTTCSKCGDTITKELPALGHTESEWKVVTPNGMFTTGVEIKECNVCSEKLQEQIIASTYPIFYLYIAIGVVALLIIVLISVILVKRR